MNLLLDNDSFESFRKGDASVMNKLYDDYVGMLYLFCFKKLQNVHDAEDVTAGTLAQLWISRETMKDPMHIHRFVFMVARNKCVDLLRAARRVTELDLIKGENEMMPDDDGRFAFERLNAQVTAEMLRQLEMEVEKLPRIRREVFRLNFMESRSIKEIADHLGIDIKTVYTHRRHAIDQLRKTILKAFT